MKRLALALLAALAMFAGLSNTTSANDWTAAGPRQEVYTSTTQLPLVAIGEGSSGCNCDDDCCDSCGGCMIYNIELTFLQYGQEGGVSNGTGDGGRFGYGIAPRFELGYAREDGLGVRGRYWFFDHSTTSFTFGDPIHVNTYMLDAEFFQAIDFCNASSLEFAGGIRYLNFNILLGDLPFPVGLPVSGHFDGFGLTTALNFRKQLAYGNVYAKSRISFLTGDIEASSSLGLATGVTHPVTQIELGVGYEVVRSLNNGALLRLRAGLESQQWLSIVPLDPPPGGFFNDDQIADASFFGFVIGGGVDY